MESMIERVARALWDIQYPTGTSWEDWAQQMARNPDGFDGRETSRTMARAAIEAMREPSEHAMDCGAYRLPGVMQEAKQAKARDVYRAMIDAALNEQVSA